MGSVILTDYLRIDIPCVQGYNTQNGWYKIAIPATVVDQSIYTQGHEMSVDN